MIPAIWYKTDSKWAAAFPKFILDACGVVKLWDIPWNKDAQTWISPDKENLTQSKTAVICIPGDSVESDAEISVLNTVGKAFEKVVWVIFSDERGLFDPDVLKHKKQIVWSFAPQFPIRPGVDRVAPFGWTTSTLDCLERMRELPHSFHRPLDWCFMGQDTHERRHKMISSAMEVPNGLLLRTKGFSQGLSQQEYLSIMRRSKFALCPGGPCTADSFRFAEALECDTIPIVDESPGEWSWPLGYWNAVCGTGLPFPTVRNWAALPQILKDWSEDYEAKRERCMRWWELFKRGLIERMREDLR